jgi:polyisoprenoid-binding protein YceI
MKNNNNVKILISSLLLSVIFLATSFKNIDGGKSVYKTDLKKSKVAWIGRAEVGDYSISGNINLSEGTLIIENEQVKGGEFVIDMNTINCTNLTGMKKVTLMDHLKGEDFFEVSKFPKTTFKITNIATTTADEHLFNVIGKLTIKGITNNVTFPATIKKEGSVVSVKAILKVDRTKFNITYHSPSFFNNLKDDYIKNEFDISLDIVGNQ